MEYRVYYENEYGSCTVNVRIQTDLPYDEDKNTSLRLLLYYKCSSPTYARLLTDSLNAQENKARVEVHNEGWDEGYSAGRREARAKIKRAEKKKAEAEKKKAT